MGRIILGIITMIALAGGISWNNRNKSEKIETEKNERKDFYHPMAIEGLRQRDYEGSDIKIERELESGINYSRQIASYYSDGNKIYGLLTIPKQGREEQKFPIIVFVHGYIPPKEYKTTERYVAYQDGLAKNGYITFKIDLRGHGESEGEAVNGHFSEAYVIDSLNAIASLKRLPVADVNRIGYWGHSNGGEIGLRSMAVSGDIDAGVFWAGVVGSMEGMLEKYNDKIPFLNFETRGVPQLVAEEGLPSENPEFWRKIDPFAYLGDFKGAIQLHHGDADTSVPKELSEELKQGLESAGKTVEYYEYPGGDHNLGGQAFGLAMKRTVNFYKQYLK